MNVHLLRNMQMRKSSSLQSFKEYRRLESEASQHATDARGALLEFETLELRLHPPNVVIDNDTYDDVTVITIDSANRPGTLIEVVQCLTELGLSIRKARISSDGGWFVDEFFVTETPKGKVLDVHKQATIRKVLSVDGDVPQRGQQAGPLLVFELSGRDKKGLMAGVMHTLASRTCEIQSAAVWTYHQKVALVVCVVDRSLQRQQQGPPHPQQAHHLDPAAPQLPPAGPHHQRSSSSTLPGQRPGAVVPAEPDPVKMAELTGRLAEMLGGAGEAHVAWEAVTGEAHHERRLHHLLLQEEERSWEMQQAGLHSWASQTGATSLSAPDQDSFISQGRPLSEPGVCVSRQGSVETSPGISVTAPHSRTNASVSTEQQQEQLYTGTGDMGMCRSSSAGAMTLPAGQEGQLSPAHSTGRQSESRSSLQPKPSGGLERSTGSIVGYVPAPTALCMGDPLNDFYQDPANAQLYLQADVRIQHSPLLKYYIVTIQCKDRNKLFFDTVCTLADMQYDVYHGAIDSMADQASQLFYLRPRSGELVLDDHRVRQLSYMLGCAVQRRFPCGLRMHMRSDRAAIPAIFDSLSKAGFSVTRAEVRTGTGGLALFDLTVADAAGQVPSGAALQRACEAAGGQQVDNLGEVTTAAAQTMLTQSAATSGPAYARSSLGLGHHSSAMSLGQPLGSMQAGQGLGRMASGVPAIHQGGPAQPGQPAYVLGSAQPLTAPLRHMSGRFQFAISSSAGREKRGPLGGSTAVNAT